MSTPAQNLIKSIQMLIEQAVVCVEGIKAKAEPAAAAAAK
tara:strand:- start:292 stop:411 length:120 start_codon:yes stop_codon:yes gene_type:complete